jgi:hypothetical protein
VKLVSVNRGAELEDLVRARHGVLILLPVLNEAENIADLLDRIEFTLAGIPHTVCIL